MRRASDADPRAASTRTLVPAGSGAERTAGPREPRQLPSLHARGVGEMLDISIEVTRARKTLADAQIKLDEIVTSTQLDRANEYSDVLKELAVLKQSLKASQDQLNRTVLLSPMRGGGE